MTAAPRPVTLLLEPAVLAAWGMIDAAAAATVLAVEARRVVRRQRRPCPATAGPVVVAGPARTLDGSLTV